MKPVQRVREFDSNVSDEGKVAMSIDEASFAHIMQVLTDLYSDPELAVIREYATNALDAHIEAGIKKPIDITLPTSLTPFFKVRDYGTGLDAEDIRDIYSKYGTSTKRGSNDVVGMLGLGCKSALTYSDQFTVTSTKDGRTIQVLVSREEDGSGSMTIVSDGPATCEQGTEIIVPAKRHNSFESKAYRFFSFWADGTVRVNGEKPERVDGMWLSDTILLARHSSEIDRDYVVMGNVAYPFLPDDEDRYQYGNYRNRFHLVAFVGIGEVLFTPSREALQATKDTKARLHALREEVKALLVASVQRNVESAKSAVEAIALARDGYDLGVTDQLTYKGRVVPVNGFDRTPPKRTDSAGQTIRHDPDESRKSFLIAGSRSRLKNGIRDWKADCSQGTLVFENFEAKCLSTTKREKLALWAEQNGVNLYQQQVYCDTLSADERWWLQGMKVYDWSIIEAIKLPKDGSTILGDGRPRGSYDALIGGSVKHVSAGEIADRQDEGTPVYWMHGNKWAVQGHDAFRLKLIDPDACITVALPENRIAKFERDFPQATNLEVAVRKLAEEWIANQPEQQREAYAFQRTHSEVAGFLRKLDQGVFHDPELRRDIVLANVSTDAYASKLQGYSRVVGLPAQHAECKRPAPLRKYPLLAALATARRYDNNPNGTAKHAAMYANMVYAQAQTATESEAA